MKSHEVRAKLHAQQKELNDRLDALTAEKGELTLRIAAGETGATAGVAEIDAAIAQAKVELDAITPALAVLDHRQRMQAAQSEIDHAEQDERNVRDALDSLPGLFSELSVAIEKFGIAYTNYTSAEDRANDLINKCKPTRDGRPNLDSHIRAGRLIDGLLWMAGAQTVRPVLVDGMFGPGGVPVPGYALDQVKDGCSQEAHRAKYHNAERVDVLRRSLQKMALKLGTGGA